jgi:hypothetical protein
MMGDIFIVVSSISDNCTYCSYGVHGIYTDLDMAIDRCNELLKEKPLKSVSESDYQWGDDYNTLEIREEKLNKSLEIW